MGAVCHILDFLSCSRNNNKNFILKPLGFIQTKILYLFIKMIFKVQKILKIFFNSSSFLFHKSVRGGWANQWGHKWSTKHREGGTAFSAMVDITPPRYLYLNNSSPLFYSWRLYHNLFNFMKRCPCTAWGKIIRPEQHVMSKAFCIQSHRQMKRLPSLNFCDN